MKGAKFFSVISVFIIACTIAHSEIILTVDGQDPAIQPLELQSSKSIEIDVVDSEALETCYDFTLSVTGGVFLHEDPTANSSASSKLIQQESVDIQTTNLATLSNIFFEFENDTGLAIIRLTTNQSLIIGGQTIPTDTEIYQFILFDMPEDRIVIFGLNYDSLSYEPPVPAESISQSESFESMGFADGESMMMSMESQQFEHVSFANAAECPDLDDDNFVNLKDFAIFSGNWLASGSGLDGDFDENGTVDLDDLDHMTTYWLYEVCTVTYVDGSINGGDGSSWASPYEYLQDALDNVQSGDEIWVAEGTYYPDEDMDSGHSNNERTETFQLVEGVAVYGGFDPDGGADEWSERDPSANVTILSGDIDDNNGTLDSGNCYNVVVGADDAVLDGFTITMGYADHATTAQYQAGGGMYNENISPNVTNCIFMDNAAYFGAGMSNNSSSPEVAGCDFIDNLAVYWGGGMENYTSSSPTVTNCLFVGNSMTDSSNGGGAIYCYSNSNAIFENCTITSNSANTAYSGGLYSDSSSPIITNTIFWNNTDGYNGYDLTAATSGNIAINYSDVILSYYTSGGTMTGDYNISTDPLFADAAGGDFHLKSAGGRWDGSQWVKDNVVSPCINTGDPTSPFAQNEPYPNGNRINMGAYGNTNEASKSGYGSLCVYLTPSTARWRLVGGDGIWRDSGYTLDGILGYGLTYLFGIEFEPEAGYETPPITSTHIYPDEITYEFITYNPL